MFGLPLANMEAFYTEIEVGRSRVAAYAAGTFLFGGECWNTRFPGKGAGVCNKTSIVWCAGDCEPVREYAKYYGPAVISQAWVHYTEIARDFPEGLFEMDVTDLFAADMHSFWSSVVMLVRHGTTGVAAIDEFLGPPTAGSAAQALPATINPITCLWEDLVESANCDEHFDESELCNLRGAISRCIAEKRPSVMVLQDSFYIVCRTALRRCCVSLHDSSHSLAGLLDEIEAVPTPGIKVAIEFCASRLSAPSERLIPGGFPAGTMVETHSLKTEALNGMKGSVCKAQDDRVSVNFAAPVGGKALKPINLRLLTINTPQNATGNKHEPQVEFVLGSSGNKGPVGAPGSLIMMTGATPHGICNLMSIGTGEYIATFKSFHGDSYERHFTDLGQLEPAEQLALAAGHLGSQSDVRKAMARGADVNTSCCPGTGYTALEWASRRGHMDIVEALLAAGAKIDVGEPLAAAAYTGQMGVLEVLVMHGADPRGNGQPHSMLPLKRARENGQAVAESWLKSKLLFQERADA